MAGRELAVRVPGSSRDTWGDEFTPGRREPSPPPLGTHRVQTSPTWHAQRARLVRFYSHYNPAKLVMVDDMLRDARGREDDLFEALVRMYGPEPPQATEDRRTRERLVRFYRRHNPSRLPDVDAVLADYRGREDQLFSALEHKYGPEP
eukprot:Hpha_TRINITY_DN31663_c0_g1::TRINITY_DN31663_c0_g1_i1::g.29137::m.29137